jgi:predicted transcriptional regulator
MVRTQIQLSEHQITALKRIAAAQHKSMAAVIRQAVDMFAKLGDVSDQKEPRARALRAAGRFKSGVNNLAENHDDYLAEAFSE